VRTSGTRPAFGRLLLEGPMTPLRELDGMTAWLAEIAQLPQDILLIVDEAEQLPESGLESLIYVMHNAPQNLHVVVAVRHGFDAALADVLAYGQCVPVGAEMLRFRFDETIALVGSRFGAREGADAWLRLPLPLLRIVVLGPMAT